MSNRPTLVVLKERAQGERRVALSPETAGKLGDLGVHVRMEAGAGLAAGLEDAAYEAAGVAVGKDPQALMQEADIVLAVQSPFAKEEDGAAAIKKGATLIGMLDPFGPQGEVLLKTAARRQVSAFSLEFLPRITRAQSMDVLSSQSNLAGYKAVVDAVACLDKAVPMMMTAAGTIQPAKVLVLGAGVAGLQAIATAKRMGAVVSAFDVRPAAREQVESLGASFIEVEAEQEETGAETAGGYAREMSKDYQQKQSDLIAKVVKEQDIVITTALIPGKPAPVLITHAMVQSMSPGAVVVDLAAVAGGNCEATKPGEIVVREGVTLIGHTNMPSLLARDASLLYARNLYAFFAHLWDKQAGSLSLDREDPVIKETCMLREGVPVHARFTEAEGVAQGKPAARTQTAAPKKTPTGESKAKKQAQAAPKPTLKEGAVLNDDTKTPSHVGEANAQEAPTG